MCTILSQDSACAITLNWPSSCHDPVSRDILAQGFIERLEPVQDTDYDDIRALLAFCEARQFLVLR